MRRQCVCFDCRLVAGGGKEVGLDYPRLILPVNLMGCHGAGSGLNTQYVAAKKFM